MHDSPSPMIGRFVAETRRELYGPWWTRRRMAEEFEVHLLDSVEALKRQGCPSGEAERVAVERFGSPVAVARSLAHSRGVGLPTQLTRVGGVAVALGAIAVASIDVVHELSESFRYSAYGDLAVPARLLLVLGVLAMYRRVRGNLGVWGRRGFQLLVAGTIAGFTSAMLWFEPGGWVALAVIAVGLGMYLTGVIRAQVLPLRAVVALTATAAAAFAIGLAGTVTGADTGRAAQMVGSIGFALSMVWIGVTLWAERSGGPSEPAAHGVLVGDG